MDTSLSSKNKRRRRFKGGKKEEDDEENNDEDAKLVSSTKKPRKNSCSASSPGVLEGSTRRKHHGEEEEEEEEEEWEAAKTKTPEEAATFEVINTTLTEMDTIIADHKQKKGDDCDEDKDLIEDLSDTIKELYLGTHFSSTKSKEIFYLAFYKLNGIQRLLSILKRITCTKNDLKFYCEDGYQELDVKKLHEYFDTRCKGNPTSFLGHVTMRALTQTRKRPISKAYIFLFLYKIMNWEDLRTGRSHGYDIIKDVCIKMQKEFIVYGGIQLLIDTNTANFHYNRMTDMKIIWNILYLVTLQLNFIQEENLNQCMFDSVLDTLILLCKFPDDQYVISIFNSILNFLNRFIQSYSSNIYAAQQFKELIAPILSKANRNPNGSYRENINADLVNKFMVTYDKYFPNVKKRTINES